MKQRGTESVTSNDSDIGGGDRWGTRAGNGQQSGRHRVWTTNATAVRCFGPVDYGDAPPLSPSPTTALQASASL